MQRDQFQHFLDAQNPTYYQVITELRNGYKESHWMWFIFPQLKGLGRSPMSLRYAIEDGKQAQEYWNHPILGKRLRECLGLVESINKTPEQIFGPIDALKYRACKALFSEFF